MRTKQKKKFPLKANRIILPYNNTVDEEDSLHLMEFDLFRIIEIDKYYFDDVEHKGHCCLICCPEKQSLHTLFLSIEYIYSID